MAICGEIQMPTRINAVIRTALARNIRPIPIGTNSSAWGNRCTRRNHQRYATRNNETRTTPWTPLQP